MYLQTSDFEIQTLQLAFQTTEIGLQICSSLHDKFLCTQTQTIFFRTILIVKTALAAMLDIGWGSSTKPLKGDPNHLPQILVAIGPLVPLHDFILFLGPNFLVLVMMATIFDD
jgi:hypothetical protein